ncbi:MAG: hypothetical protein Tsb0032_05970 [Kiloniellaceae bacterium]
MSRRQAAVGLVVAAVGGAFLHGATLIETDGEPVGPQTFPYVAASLLVFLGLMILVTGLRPAGAAMPAEEGAQDWPQARYFWRIVLPTTVFGLLYVVAWHWLGYLIATLLVAPLGYIVLGARGRIECLVVPLAVTLTLYLVFFMGMKLYDAPGQLFN